jgi:hypothetical protein
MRRVFAEGSPVIITYLATTERGVVERVEDEGRSLLVITESDELLRFHLMAPAMYITRDRSARLMPAEAHLSRASI